MAAEGEKTESTSAPASATASSSAGEGGGGSKLVLILTGVNLLVTIAMVAILFVSYHRDKSRASVEDITLRGPEAASSEHGEAGKEGEGHSPAKKKKTLDTGKMLTLDQFTINLSTPGSSSSKFVRVNISLEVINEDAESEVNSKMPQIRNAIIDLFNSKKPADLATVDGRDYLKDEIKNALDSFLVTGKLKGIYFTNFALSS